MPVGQSIADVMTGVHAVAAIGYALFHRERIGKGQFLDIAMVDSLFHSQELSTRTILNRDEVEAPKVRPFIKINSPLGAFKGHRMDSYPMHGSAMATLCRSDRETRTFA